VLERDGAVLAGSRTALGRAVHEGTWRPDLATPETFSRARRRVRASRRLDSSPLPAAIEPPRHPRYRPWGVGWRHRQRGA